MKYIFLAFFIGIQLLSQSVYAADEEGSTTEAPVPAVSNTETSTVSDSSGIASEVDGTPCTNPDGCNDRTQAGTGASGNGENGDNGGSRSGEAGNGASEPEGLDLYAPFASQDRGNNDIFCKTLKEKCDGNGCYNYEVYQGGECNGVIIQKLRTNGDASAQGIFNAYIGLVYIWLIGFLAAAAILMTVVGGIEIIISSDEQGKSSGLGKMQKGLAGLALILLTAVFLRTVNPNFYKITQNTDGSLRSGAGSALGTQTEGPR